MRLYKDCFSPEQQGHVSELQHSLEETEKAMAEMASAHSQVQLAGCVSTSCL